MFTFSEISLLCAAIVLWIVVYLKSQQKPKNFPPGPWGFPILGHLPLLGLEPYKTTMRWKAKYGPIVGLNFGSFPCIVISDYKLAKEAGANPAFAGRPNVEFAKQRCGGRQVEGIVFTTGRTWREQRTFTHRRLREIGGFGTRSMEAAIAEQVEELIQRLRTDVGQLVSTHLMFNVAVFNALWSIIAGSPFKQDDQDMQRLIQVFSDAISKANFMGTLVIFIPLLGRIFPDWLTRKREVDRVFDAIFEFIKPKLDASVATHVQGQGEPRDFIDAFLNEMKSTTDPSSSFFSERGIQSLSTTVLDVFAAGVETTATTLEWVCLLFGRFTDIQERLFAEIENAVGRKRPTLADRKRMPYTEAFLHEVMRYRTLLPFGVFHSTVEPVQFHGFDIPEDTMVFLNPYAAHFDEELWGDPEEFKPERWLNDDVTDFVRREGFMPFGTGKRVCLGDQLARDELFLFCSGLAQSFRIAIDPNGPTPTLDPTIGGTTTAPKPHRLIFNLRKYK